MGARAGAARRLCSAAGDLLGAMERPETWERFYARREAAGGGHFDWFFGYEAVAELLSRAVAPRRRPAAAARVLDVGCGTSALGPALARESRHPVHVWCVDTSPAALAALRRLLRGCPPPRHPRSRLRLYLGDAGTLTAVPGGLFPPASFRLVLDKGTSDALLRRPDGGAAARGLLAECVRLLAPGGSLLHFSDEDPDARGPLLEAAAGGVSVAELRVPGGGPYYVYTVVKS